MEQVRDAIDTLIAGCSAVLEWILTPTGNVVAGLVILSAGGAAVWLTRRKTPTA